MPATRHVSSAVLVLALFSSFSLADDELHYELTPLPADQQLKVSFAWKTQGTTRSTMSVTEHWGPVRDVPPLFSDVTFEGVTKTDQEGRNWNLEHAEGATIKGSYRVNCGWPMDWEHCYYPIVTPDYFHLIGYVFLLIPGRDDTSTAAYRVSMKWNLPEHWPTVVGPWGQGRELSATLSTNDLLHCIYVSGNFVTRTTKVMGQPVTIALPDRFKFTPDAFAQLVSRIIEQQRAFMADNQFPPFLVTGVCVGEKLPEGTSSLGGTGLYNSFAAFLPPDAVMDERLQFLLSHELFHYWNGRILDRQQPEELIYWFSEGVTDYYASRLLFDAGLWTAQTFADWLNDKLAAYARNPARNATNDEIKEGFWSRRQSAGEIAYQRGLLLAVRWHRMAQERGISHGFDRLFHHLVKRAREAGYRASNESLREHGIEQLGPWFAEEFDRYVTRAETIDLPLNALGPKFESAVARIFDQDLGFDFETSQQQKKVTGLRTGSAAEVAGLREGDDLTGWSVHLGDVDKEVILQVRREGKVQDIRYLPHGPALEVIHFRPAAPQ